MGRIFDGADSLGYFLNSTPGASNSTKAYAGITYYLPKFSVKGGFYNGSVSVILSSIDGLIRYTLDGSLPVSSSPVYNQPVQISQTSQLRARVFVDNQIPGKPVTHSYFINENVVSRGLPVVSITTNDGYFWAPDTGLYVQNFKPTWEYPINIELFENDGSDRAAFNELAGTKVNGLNSWVLPQKMLGIYFDNDYDKNSLEYPLFFDRPRTRFDNFTLRASGSDWSYTLFRDGLCQTLTAGFMDLERMGFRPSVAYVNGQYMGIHNLRSRIDEGYIEENFGYAGNEYDLIENNGLAEQGDAQAFQDLFALFDKDLSVPVNYQAVGDVMDIPNFTDYFITEIWSSNGSWGHNIQMWKPKTANSKWRWILQDLDRGFTGSADHKIAYFKDNGVPASYNWARKSLRSMLGNTDFQKTFSTRFT
ncbi:MAG: CotH kinase family protein, partial [Bacteroidetes bacterium]|nr:CotH kinase family protein [Bacteroidota bacterium]